MALSDGSDWRNPPNNTMYRNDWIDQQSMRINTLRSVYPGLTDQQIAKQHAVRMSSHVAVRYKHTNASDFTRQVPAEGTHIAR